MKRIVCFLLCVILLVNLVPVAGYATSGNNFSWTLDEMGTLTISGTGEMPNWNEGDAPWFDDRDNIFEVIVESGVTSIGDYAFFECTWLRTAHLPESVEWIGLCAFMSCVNLEEINFPGSLIQVDGFAFWDCRSIESVILGAAVTEIKGSAFYGCIGLQELWLPESVTKIESLAFWPMEIQNVYYEGTEEGWNQLGTNVPRAVQLHYECESIGTHWIPYCAGEWCSCGYSRLSENHTGIHVYDQQRAEAAFKASDATCEKPAMYYKSCFCGKAGTETFSDGKARDHEFNQKIVADAYLKRAATCTEKAVYYQSCICGRKGEETFESGEMLPHEYDQQKVDAAYLVSTATCTKQAIYQKSCICGQAGTDTFTHGDLKEHVYDQEKPEGKYLVSEATCTEQAEYRKSCICGDVGDKTFPYGQPKGHGYEPVVTDPTCTDQGYTTYTCACGDSYKEHYVDAKGHSWNDATCVMPKICSVCGETDGMALGHNWSSASCTEPKCCKICGVTDGAALGHHWIEASCTAAKTCTICSVSEGEALGHRWQDATCSEPMICTVCMATEGSPKGHSWVDATCTEPKTCKICGATEGSANGHTFDQEKVDEKYLVSEGVYYKSCKCGEKGTETFTVREDKPEDKPEETPVEKPEDKPEVKPVEFKDVAKNAFFYDAVMWAVQNKVTSGTGDGTTFSPNEICTRGQVVTFLWRAAGQPEPKNAVNPFVDVNSTDFFYKAVLWAKENGITTGTTATTFSPNDNCNRGQIVTFLCRAKNGQPVTNNNPFVDVATNAFYYNPVLWAVENKITTGTGDGTTFEPGTDCTRGQVITFLYRAYK